MRTIPVFYCLLYAALTGGKGDLEGFVGGRVSIRCVHKFARDNKKYLCKAPCGTGDILATVAPGGRTESGRITLVDSGNGDFLVVFHQLQLLDSQTYYCGVDRSGFDTFAEIQLTVKEGDMKWTVLPPLSPHTTVVKKTKTVPLDVASTDTPLMVAESTQSSSAAEIEVHFVPSTNSRPDVTLSAVVGGLLTLAALILVACCGNCGGTSKPQPAVRSISEPPVEVDSEYDDIDQVTQCVETVSPASSVVILRPLRDPPASALRPPECWTSHQSYQTVRYSEVEGTSVFTSGHD